MYDLGLILKDLRRRYGFSQAEVAKAINVSSSMIAGWENNYKLPSINKLVGLSDLYNVPLDYLVGINDNNAITINQLSESQQTIVNELVEELRLIKSKESHFTQKQQDIVKLLINEFTDLN